MTEIAYQQPALTRHGRAELAPLFDALAEVATRGDVAGPGAAGPRRAGPADAVRDGTNPQ